jgi:1-acyl-sn-glycerol-3-phosphate acyltransferase
MIIALYYVLATLYFSLFYIIFGIDISNYTSVVPYLLVIVSLVLSFVLSFASILALVSILGEFRKNKPFNNKFNHDFANGLMRLAMHIIRVKVIVTGKEHIPDHNKFVLMGNHQENYDIPVLMPIFKDHPICFIAKKALFEVPIIGKWIGLLGNVPIGKMADREAAKSIITGIKRHKEGIPFGIFPEGRRSRSNEMIDFKAGAFKLAMKSKSDILIVTQYDMNKVLKSFPWKPYKVYVDFLPILKYEEYKDMNSQDLSDFVKAKIQARLDQFAKEV